MSLQIKVLMVIDLEGFTKFSETHSQEELKELIDNFEKFVNEIAERFSGEVIKILGDGALIIFDSAENSIKAGKEIVQNNLNGLKIRAFAHIGDFIIDKEKKDVFGFHVNFAFRLLGFIPGGIFGASEPLYHIITQKEDFAESPKLSVKGISHPVRFFFFPKSQIKFRETDDVKFFVKEAPWWLRAISFYVDILIFSSTFGVLSSLAIAKLLPKISYSIWGKNLDFSLVESQGEETKQSQQEQKEEKLSETQKKEKEKGEKRKVVELKSPVVGIEGGGGKLEVHIPKGKIEAEPGRVKLMFFGKEISISYIQIGGSQVFFFILYLTLFWYFAKGRTPGDFLCSLKVEKITGDNLDFLTAFLRALLSVAFTIFLGIGIILPMIFLRKSGQDILTKTRVVVV
jgi:Adenylate cyclase, family 3 (some proteins contain HAMP domain)